MEITMKLLNFRTNRMRTTALALCAFALASTPIWAQAPQDAPPPPPQDQGPGYGGHGRPGMEHMQERRIEMLTKHLNLTPDQVAQVKAIDKDGMEQMMALHQDTATAPEEKHAKMKSIHEAQNAKIRAVLTAEQQPKFDAMLAHEHERMEQREHRGEGGPDGPPPPPPPAA
jgi:Spy/CpxP family protein refolding chaperone